MFNKSKNEFFLGINYWDSAHATNMWKEYDPAVIEADMKAMQSAGLTALRVFPSWPDFQPLTAQYAPNTLYEMQLNGKPLPDTEAGKAGVSEDVCKHFENFCDLAHKYGFKLIVGLITGQMSFGLFMPDGLKGKNPITDPYAVRWELRFIKYFVNRFKNHPAIAGWDLGNECNILSKATEDEFYVWMSNIANAIRSADPDHPVVSGMASHGIARGVGNMKDVGEVADIHTVHPYALFELPKELLNSLLPTLNPAYRNRIAEDISGIPTFVQEFGAIGYLTCSPKEEAEFYRAAALSAIAHHCHGIMYWCAFDQGHIDFAPYNWNNIGSQYGFFKADYGEKPIVAENKKIAELINALPNGLSKPITDGVAIIPRDDVDNLDNDMRITFALAKRAGINLKFSYALDPIPDAGAYFITGIRSTKPITKSRYNELLEKIKNGASLYLSINGCYFREIPEVAGVTIHSRYQRDNRCETILDGEVLPVFSNTTYKIEPTTAEVLATDEKGNPVFFKNKYGKGYVYFTTLSLETHIKNLPGAFYDEGVPPYELFYKKVMETVPSKRLINAAHPFIFITEHIIDDNSRYIFAVNHSPDTKSLTLDITDDYTLSVIWGEELKDNIITLNGCDGIIIKATKTAIETQN